MGVQGLWNILHCCGYDLDMNSLKGKILAVDLSIWLNQALKSANNSPNAHLEILFNRICKLLFYKIKPVFIFDGKSPSIKKFTIEMRQKRKQLASNKTEKIKANIINILMEKNLTHKIPTSFTYSKKELNDIFQLNDDKSEDILNDKSINASENSDIASDYISNFNSIDDVDIESDLFYNFPYELQYEILMSIIKEKRYGDDKKYYNDMSSNDFSNLQIKKVLDRNNIQQKVIGLRSVMNYHECQQYFASSDFKYLGEFKEASISAKKVMSHEDGFLMLIDSSDNDFIKSLSESKKEKMHKNMKRNSTVENIKDKMNNKSNEIPENLLDQQNTTDIMKSLSQLKKNIENDYLLNDEQSEFEKKILNTKNDDCNDSVKKKSDIIKESNNGTSIPISSIEIFEESQKDYDVFNVQQNQFETDKITKNEIVNYCNELKDIKNTIIQVEPKEKAFEFHDYCSPIHSCADQNNLIESDSDNEDDFIDVPNLDYSSNDQEIINSAYQRQILENNTDTLPKLNFKSKSINESYGSNVEIQNQTTDPIADFSDDDSLLYTLCDKEQKLEHQSMSLSSHYFEDAKELLKLFGIPFVESPSEAEAQCAFLENEGLTNGSITEDSDIWLFGGKKVYKYMFTRGFTVKEYNMDHINRKLGLNRELMICIALLSGSDYTPGVYGVGPVNAMEILAEFSDPNKPMTYFEILQLFKTWCNDYKNSLNYTGNSRRKKFLKFELDKNFPDRLVYESYLKPLVDESKSSFIWSLPSTEKLIEFVHSKLGWSKLKIIERLEIALKGIQSTTQKEISDFFDKSGNDLEQIPSKRFKQATQQMNLIVNNS